MTDHATVNVAELDAERLALRAELRTLRAAHADLERRHEKLREAANKIKRGRWMSASADNFDYEGDVYGIVGTDWNEFVAALTPPAPEPYIVADNDGVERAYESSMESMGFSKVEPSRPPMPTHPSGKVPVWKVAAIGDIRSGIQTPTDPSRKDAA